MKPRRISEERRAGLNAATECRRVKLGCGESDDEYFYTTVTTFCPCSGAANEEGMMFSEKMSKWVCLTCGATV